MSHKPPVSVILEALMSLMEGQTTLNTQVMMLNRKVDTLMANIDDVKAAQTKEAADLQTLMSDIADAISEAQAAKKALQDQIAALQAQIAAGGGPPVDLQPLVDASSALDSTIGQADAAVKAAVANINPPPPTV